MPLDLRRPVDGETKLPAEYRTVRESTPIPASRQIPVRRAVLWALENNCYLRIDGCLVSLDMALSTDSRFVQGDGSPCGVRESYIALGVVDLANIIRQCRPGKQDAGYLHQCMQLGLFLR